MKQDINALVKRCHQMFQQQSLTLSLAESCTGGALAAHITTIAGASDFFLGGIIAYCVAAKCNPNTLAVSEEVIKTHGVVSTQTAAQMANGAQRLFQSDYTLATTGVAGPHDSHDGPAGLVCFAIARPNKELITYQNQFKGARLTVIEAACCFGLEALISLMR